METSTKLEGESIFTSDNATPVTPEHLNNQLEQMDIEAKLLQEHMSTRRNIAEETTMDTYDPTTVKKELTQTLTRLDSIVEQYEHLQVLLNVYQRDRKEGVLEDSIMTNNTNLDNLKPVRSTLRGLQLQIGCLL